MRYYFVDARIQNPTLLLRSHELVAFVRTIRRNLGTLRNFVGVLT